MYILTLNGKVSNRPVDKHVYALRLTRFFHKRNNSQLNTYIAWMSELGGFIIIIIIITIIINTTTSTTTTTCIIFFHFVLLDTHWALLKVYNIIIQRNTCFLVMYNKLANYYVESFSLISGKDNSLRWKNTWAGTLFRGRQKGRKLPQFLGQGKSWRKLDGYTRFTVADLWGRRPPPPPPPRGIQILSISCRFGGKFGKITRCRPPGGLAPPRWENPESSTELNI